MGGAVIMHQNRLIRRFQDAEATRPKSAKSLMDIGCRKSWVFRRMVAKGVTALSGNLVPLVVAALLVTCGMPGHSDETASHR